MRIYDLKGSSHNRQVQVDNKTDVFKKTLKDIDFIQQEQTLKISDSKTKALLSIIRNDVHFLFS